MAKKLGKSKYAKKVEQRRKLALKVGLPANTPMPILWLYQTEVQ